MEKVSVQQLLNAYSRLAKICPTYQLHIRFCIVYYSCRVMELFLGGCPLFWESAIDFMIKFYQKCQIFAVWSEILILHLSIYLVNKVSTYLYMYVGQRNFLLEKLKQISNKMRLALGPQYNRSVYLRFLLSYAEPLECKCSRIAASGITFPSGQTQKRLMGEVYDECGLLPSDVSYVEAHGTGTKAGDPEELNAIAELFCKGREDPLLIGSTKSNMGHPEPSSGTKNLHPTFCAHVIFYF